MLWKKTRHDGIDVAFIGGCSRSADALEGRAPLSKAKDVAPQSSATFALSARCEARGMPRELVNTVLERFDKAALELKAVVGPRFEDRSRTRCVGSFWLHRRLRKLLFDNVGFLIFCGARVTGFSSVLQHINERKESFIRGMQLR
jgi:hypothetical protein